MTDISFAPKEVIPSEVCRLEILDADKSDTYGPQIYLKLRVLGGEHDGHQFNDYSTRDENTGQVKQGGKAWSIFEACLGQDFYQQPGVSLKSLIGKRFMAQVAQTKTGSRNKVEHGTVGSIPPEGVSGDSGKSPENGNNGDDDDMFAEMPI